MRPAPHIHVVPFPYNPRRPRWGSTMTLKFATFEMSPCVYDEEAGKAWVLWDRARGWYPMPFAEVWPNAKLFRSNAERDEVFAGLPPLPSGDARK